MSHQKQPVVSIIFATHNRKPVVLDTLARLEHCGLARSKYEVLVVDNASTDGTPDAVAGLVDHLHRLTRNAGSCAKTLLLDQALGPIVMFLDDDAVPRPGSIERMLYYFESNPKLGAAGFSVELPDGTRECSALPSVFHGCAVGFRTEAIRQVGGLDLSFFMQAEEYDLSFRLAGAGWSLHVFPDLAADHLKTGTSRRSDRTTYYDVRNNLLLAARYLPEPFHRIYARDWLQRYRWLAQVNGHRGSFGKGALTGVIYCPMQRFRYRNKRLSASSFERFFCLEFVRERMAQLARDGVRRIVLADLGKNIYAFHRAAKVAGIEILAIADDHFAVPQHRVRQYRGTPILTTSDALALDPQAIVVSNMAVTIAERTEFILKQTQACLEQPPIPLNGAALCPIYRWFHAEQSVADADNKNQENLMYKEGSTHEEASAQVLQPGGTVPPTCVHGEVVTVAGD